MSLSIEPVQNNQPGLKPKVPDVVIHVLRDPELLKAKPSKGSDVGPPLSNFVFWGNRICDPRCGCPLALNSKTEFQNETGGVIHVRGDEITVEAHVGNDGEPFITRSLTKQAPVGFHSHIAEGRRNFNPPTTTDVNLFIQLCNQNHTIRREAELVFTEEGVYVIHGKPNYVDFGTLKKNTLERFRERWPELVDQNILLVDAARDNSVVPFFQYNDGKGREELEYYLSIFQDFGVFIDLVDWEQTGTRR
jgi:hypothetical protein